MTFVYPFELDKSSLSELVMKYIEILDKEVNRGQLSSAV